MLECRIQNARIQNGDKADSGIVPLAETSIMKEEQVQTGWEDHKEAREPKKLYQDYNKLYQDNDYLDRKLLDQDTQVIVDCTHEDEIGKKKKLTWEDIRKKHEKWYLLINECKFYRSTLHITMPAYET